MSSDDNHRQAHMMPTAHKICGIFTTSSFNFGPPTYLVSHYCCRRAQYPQILCSKEADCATRLWCSKLLMHVKGDMLVCMVSEVELIP